MRDLRHLQRLVRLAPANYGKFEHIWVALLVSFDGQ
jgi:hypothetical protein